MKTITLSGLCAALTLTSILNAANAASISGQGTWETTLHARDLDGNSATVEAYYDAALNITWLADANYAKASGYDVDGLMTWQQSVAWAEQLDYGGYTEWRLPTVSPLNGIEYVRGGSDYDGTTDNGWNVSAPGTIYAGSIASEYAHLFYNTLGNISSFHVDGSQSECSPTDCLRNAGPFSNMLPYIYWAGTVSNVESIASWAFVFNNGRQDDTNNYNEFYAWAVHSGDIGGAITEVPVPAAAWLFASGLLGLLAVSRRRPR